MNYQKLGKALLSEDEIAVLDGGKCIMLLRGVRPFLSSKYDITKHPNYKYLSDHDKTNTFEVEKFLEQLRKPRPALKPNQPFHFVDITDEPAADVEIEDADAIGEIE